MKVVFVGFALLLLLQWAAAGPFPEDFAIEKAECAGIGSGVAPASDITDMEACHLCELIVENSKRWNGWRVREEITDLCLGVPTHLLASCEYLVCRLVTNCPSFDSMKCGAVDQSGNEAEISPCLPEMICKSCLHIPKAPIRGCFDGLHKFI